MDIKIPTFEFSLERQFHCLRHFEYLGCEQLIQIATDFPGYSFEQIDKELKLIGSKFHRTFALSPINLLDELSGANSLKHMIETGQSVFQFSFDPLKFPNGIGNSAIVKISGCSDEERAQLKKIRRGQFEVWSLSVSELPPTWTMTIISRSREESCEIITLFPGEYAPKFPIKGDPNESINRLFWEDHAFLMKF